MKRKFTKQSHKFGHRYCHMSKALQVVIPSNNPNAMKVVTIPGWSGRSLIVPRQSIKELKELPENSKPGIYMLFGQNESSAERLAYIGESENFFKRITSHDATKDFWDTAIIFTGELNRAYVKYLEHCATLLASESKRMQMQNKVQPKENTLSDFDKLAADQYFEQMQFVLSALSYEIFEKLDESKANAEMYYLKLKGADARAKLLENGNMLVLAGSIASIHETNSFEGWAQAARHDYLKRGILQLTEDKEHYVFTQDQLFRKPSPAAAVIAARSINGWTAWKDAAGLTLDQNNRA